MKGEKDGDEDENSGNPEGSQARGPSSSLLSILLSTSPHHDPRNAPTDEKDSNKEQQEVPPAASASGADEVPISPQPAIASSESQQPESSETRTAEGNERISGLQIYDVEGGTDIPRYVQQHNATLSFPEKLMLMLTHVEKTFQNDPPVGWVLEGRAFSIFDKDRLTNEILPEFFGPGQFKSFTRKLYRWGFRQIAIPTSPSHPKHSINFGNEHFQRDDKERMMYMRSVTAAGRRRKEQRQRNTGISSSSASGQIQYDQQQSEGNTEVDTRKRPAIHEHETASELRRAAIIASNRRFSMETSEAEHTTTTNPASAVPFSRPYQTNPSWVMQQAALANQNQLQTNPVLSLMNLLSQQQGISLPLDQQALQYHAGQQMLNPTASLQQQQQPQALGGQGHNLQQGQASILSSVAGAINVNQPIAPQPATVQVVANLGQEDRTSAPTSEQEGAEDDEMGRKPAAAPGDGRSR